MNRMHRHHPFQAQHAGAPRGEDDFTPGGHGGREHDRERGPDPHHGPGHHHGPEACFGARGPRGFGGRHHGFGPFGFGGGPGGGGFRAGRKISSADLQLLIVALLGEKPRHGYDLIKEIEARSNGYYSPSPGVIYPALSYLEDAGEARAEADGTRKLFHLTDDGRRRLEAQGAEARALLEQLAQAGRGMDRVREAFSADADGDAEGDERGAGRPDPFERGPWGRSPELASAREALRAALHGLRHASREELARVAGILRRAAEEIGRG